MKDYICKKAFSIEKFDDDGSYTEEYARVEAEKAELDWLRQPVEEVSQ